MRIRDIINEAANKPDEMPPQDDELEPDELDSETDDDETDDEDDSDRDAALEDFVELAGNLGNDLYSITMYDYSNEFSSIGPNSRVENVLTDLSGDPIIDQYLGVGEMQTSDDKIVGAVILNDRNGKFFAYYSGDGVEGFSPQESVQGLVGAGIISSDQVAPLQGIARAGKQYNKIVSNTYWDAGETAEDSRVYSALDALTSALALPDLPVIRRVPRDDELSDEQREFNKKLADKMKDSMEKRIQQYMAKQANIKKTKGAGREKR